MCEVKIEKLDNQGRGICYVNTPSKTRIATSMTPTIDQSAINLLIFDS